jgi:hypothetical protein
MEEIQLVRTLCQESKKRLRRKKQPVASHISQRAGLDQSNRNELFAVFRALAQGDGQVKGLAIP